MKKGNQTRRESKKIRFQCVLVSVIGAIPHTRSSKHTHSEQLSPFLGDGSDRRGEAEAEANDLGVLEPPMFPHGTHRAPYSVQTQLHAACRRHSNYSLQSHGARQTTG